MRKTLPLVFLAIAVLGAAAIGYMASSFGLSDLRSELAHKNQEFANLESRHLALLKSNEEDKAALSQKMEVLEQRLQGQVSAMRNAERITNQKMEELQAKSAQDLKRLSTTNKQLQNKLDESLAQREQLQTEVTQQAERQKTVLSQQAQNLRAKWEANVESQIQKAQQEQLKNFANEKLALENSITELKAQIDEQNLKAEEELKDLRASHQLVLATAQEEKDYLYAELDRYAQTTSDMFKKLGEDVGGLDILLTPEFKSNFAEFLGEINLNSN